MSEKKGFSAPFWGKTEGNWGPLFILGVKLRSNGLIFGVEMKGNVSHWE